MYLVERSESLTQLLDALREFSAGSGGVAVLSGAIATGKTALVDAFVEHATASGAHVVRAAGAQAERDLPLGLLHQLLGNSGRLLPIDPAWLTALRQTRARNLPAPDGAAPEPDAILTANAWFIQELCGALLDLAGAAPVVVVVEDVQHADLPSLHGLLYLARRLRSAPIMLVLTTWTHPLSAFPQFYAELLRQPNTVQVRLGPLSRDGVRELLAQRLGATRAAQLAGACHQISGGNPALVRALVDDQPDGTEATRAAGSPGAAEPVVGEAFSQAVVGCLYRGDPRVLSAARAAAVLGPEATPAAVARLLGVDGRPAELAMLALARIGLLDGYAFRHPAARAAVLEELPEELRAGWHLRAAELLHRRGVVAATVAEHLIAAGGVPGPWAVEVLGETAARASAAGQNRLAADCLSLALESVPDPAQRAQLTAALATVEWSMTASTASRHLAGLVHAVREGQLDGSEAIATTRLLLWYGHLDAAVESFNLVAGSGNSASPAELRLIRAWLCFAFPRLAGSLTELPPADPVGGPSHASPGMTRQAAAALAAALRGGDDEHTVQYAEQVLQSSDLAGSTVDAVISALSALICSGRAAVAAPWCDLFIERAAGQQAPTWHALLLAIRSEIAICLGDMALAETQARAALAAVDEDGWGAMLALPVANLLLVLTATGQHEKAAECLATPKPAAIFESRYGLRYTYARGQHYLAIGHLQAAIGDFLACGELMRGWNMDLSWIAPWRLGAAEASLRLGDPDRCRRFAQEQLDLIGKADPRTAGIALRLLAATGLGQQERRSLLRESVQLLESSNDQLELAKSLGDLSDVYQAIGAPGKARLLARRAIRVAGAWGFCVITGPPSLPMLTYAPEPAACCEAPEGSGGSRDRLLGRESAPGGADGAARAESNRLASLSDAERRVGSLAARGYSNREIAQRLYITVSTVEQHLTRIYRKLSINGRADLPVSL